MRKGTWVVLVLIVVAGGLYLGSALRKGGGADDGPPIAADGIDRKRVPLVGPAKGPADALVNIVEFSDFQCPFCGRVNPTLKKLQEEYAGKVRIFFRHYPLPFHGDAHLAAQAAMAAQDQGKFWEMHDKLFANPQALKRADLERYAGEIGLAVDKFKQALDQGIYKSKVDQDMQAGSAIGVTGTPAFFINGRFLSGAQPYEKFKEIVDDEVKRGEKLVAGGVRRDRLYDKLMQAAGTAAAGTAKAEGGDQPAPRAVASADRFKVPVGGSPRKGGAEPKVTIIVFSEFQCPFCARALPTIDKMLSTYKDDVAIVWKHMPLPFHNNARIAASAAEAARAQGKFWEMHDKLFANQQMLDRASLDKYAAEVGLDAGKFKAFLDGDKGKATIDADEKLAAQFGVRGTPSFFLNGRQINGAYPFESFKEVIDEELKQADEKLKAGVARAQLYAELTKDGKDKAEAPKPPPGAAEPGEGDVLKVDVAGAPSKGPKDALVTMVVFSEFQCPFCARVEPTLAQVMDTYKGKVRLVWRDYPLPFHQDAVPAAVLARVAGEAGKFWEMHDKLFANQKALDRASLERYAQELGLPAGKVKAALDNPGKYKSAIDADMAMGTKVGVRGTPAFFINGTFLSGAQPFEAFQARIDAELKKAEALVAKGTPKSKIYETIMKKAKEQVTAGGDDHAEEAGPEADKTVHKVTVGDAPARGPKNAPVTLIMFSEFQCPFCARIKPTMDQIEREYGNKVRFAFKHFPLDFHQNARPAAMAAMAANAQGKFWQMHDKLFANQQALDRASLDKYAEELGLDMARFKKDMDAGAHGSVIDGDMKEGQALGVSGTPAVFVNGRKVAGAYPFETFKKIIDQELARAKRG